MTLKECLINEILHSGLTRYQIGKATGLSQASLSRFVNGKRNLNLDTIEKLFQFFKLKVVKDLSALYGLKEKV